MGRRKKTGGKKETSRRNESRENIAKNVAIPLSTKDAEKSSPRVPQPKLMDVYERLELPFLKLNENNLLTESDDEETLEFEIRPRFVFSGCMCVVCQETSDESLVCEKCRMISYCKLEHAVENRASHLALCEAICQEFGGIGAFRFAKNAENYRSLRIKFIEGVERRLSRSLELWEREIILYPRICRACRKCDNLVRCPTCSFDLFCPEHSQEHEKWCKDFRVFRRILWMQQKHGYAIPNFPDARRKTDSPLATNLDALFLEMFENNMNYRRIDAHTYASMSLAASAPLTALFALEKTRDDLASRESLKIDIVGAEFQYECSTLRAWEKLFLHYLPGLKRLCLEFTGPELYLPGAPIELLRRVALCRRCKKEKRRVSVAFNERKLYHEVTSESQADLICLFNPGLYRFTGYDGIDTWPETIERFCRARVPVLVTSYTEVEIPRDVQRIQSISRAEILLEPQKNPFASVKPDRNFVSDDLAPLMYKNYCLSILRGI